MDAGCEQRLRLRTRGKRMDIDPLRLAPAQGVDIAHQPYRVAPPGTDVDTPATRGRDPLHLAGGEIEAVYDCARHSENLPQGLDHGGCDRFRRLFGNYRLVNLA